jgi:hypothetical protein
MGRGRYIYVSDFIDEKLKKISNRSKLINDLLEDHFRKEDFEQMSPAELKKLIKIEKMKKEMEIKIQEIQNG